MLSKPGDLLDLIFLIASMTSVDIIFVIITLEAEFSIRKSSINFSSSLLYFCWFRLKAFSKYLKKASAFSKSLWAHVLSSFIIGGMGANG